MHDFGAALSVSIAGQSQSETIDLSKWLTYEMPTFHPLKSSNLHPPRTPYRLFSHLDQMLSNSSSSIPTSTHAHQHSPIFDVALKAESTAAHQPTNLMRLRRPSPTLTPRARIADRARADPDAHTHRLTSVRDRQRRIARTGI
ncbi:hypothetical protein A0H81_00060 [Grifola frondosa]|uniref:Uncharacterized protein n=1 Tax=Grifola frondosa TaxID=5627 RepID=A0A1C7MQK0_GRIFR|nr:hypothetical protein A0H81_00060 [Grifola frondosa]